jgi:hypothetical protein
MQREELSSVLTNNIRKFLKIGEASKYLFKSILGPYADLDLSINVDTTTHPARETVPLVDKILPPNLHWYEDNLRLFFGLDQSRKFMLRFDLNSYVGHDKIYITRKLRIELRYSKYFHEMDSLNRIKVCLVMVIIRIFQKLYIGQT